MTASVLVPYCVFTDGAVSTLQIVLIYKSKTTKDALNGEKITVTTVDLNRTALVTGSLQLPVACGLMMSMCKDLSTTAPDSVCPCTRWSLDLPVWTEQVRVVKTPSRAVSEGPTYAGIK